ncbi:Ig-like domain-containing protein [Ferdinandcohnia sp. Marseille-Q9671]
MISRSYRKNKSVLWLPIAFVLVLSGVLFSLNVSSQVETKQYITFNKEKWEIGKEFSNEWYISGETLQFQVDLTEDYQNYLKPEGDNSGEEVVPGDGTTNEDPPQEPAPTPPAAGEIPEGGVPFEIKANGTVNITEEPEGEFTGLYTVTVTDLGKDGKIPVEIEFSGETWVNEPPTRQTTFYVKKDTAKPVVTLWGPEDGKYYRDTIHLNIGVEEENFNKDNVTVSIKKDESEFTPNNPIQWNGRIGTIAFDQVGYYEITVTAKDKVGNESDPKTIAFGNISKSADLRIDNKTDNNFYKEDVQVVVENPLNIKSAILTYTKHGEEPKDVNMEVEGLIFKKKATYSLTEEGTYDITAKVTDRRDTEQLGTIQNIIIDKTAPEVSITGVANGSKYKESKKLVTSATDPNLDENRSVLTITKDGKATQVTGADALGERTLTDGNYTVELSVFDKAGNEKKSPAVSFTIDTTKPVVSISGIENEKYYPNDQDVHFTVEDLTLDLTKTTLVVKHNETDYAEEITLKQNGTKAEASHTFEDEGVYTVELSSTDLAGNEPVSIKKSFTIDKTKPEVSVTGIDNNVKYNSKVDMDIVAKDTNLDNNSTVLTVTKDGDSETFTGKDAHKTHSFKDEGVYEISVDYFDKAGNKADFSTITFVIDNSKPEVDITGVSENEYYNSNKEVVFTVEDQHVDLSKIELSITKDDESYLTDDIKFKKENKPKRAEAKHTFTENGVYVLNLKSTDEAGNTSMEKEVTFTIDQILPEIAVTNIGEGGKYNEDRHVNITVRDINMGESKVSATHNGENYKIDPFTLDGQEATTEHTFTEDGVYTVVIESTDKAGNVSTKTINFKVDQTGPEILYSIENDTYFNDKKVDLTVSVADYTLEMPEITVTRTRNGKTEEVETGGWLEEIIWIITQRKTISLQDEGVYAVKVTAKDEFKVESTKELAFTIDHTSPEILINGIENGAFVQKNNELTIDINDLHFNAEKNEVFVNGKKIEDAKWEETATGYRFKQTFPKDGEYEVTVKSEDFAGNKSAEAKRSFTVDNVKPEIKIEKVKDGTYYDKKQSATIKVNELNFNNNNVKINVTKNGAPYPFNEWKNQDVQSSLEIPFNEDGDYVIKVSATDAAGNVADAQEVKFTVDETFPVLNITGVEHMTNYNVTKPVTFEVRDTNIDQTSLRVTKNGKPYEVGTLTNSGSKASLTHQFQDEGSYVLYLNATDKSGNKTTHDEIAFIVDKTNPVVNIDGVDHQSFNPTGKRVTVSVDELNFGTNYVVLSVTKDGKTFNIGTWQNNNKLSSLGYNFNDDGLYTIAISTKDKAGNGPIAANKTFTIDTTKPAIDITGVENAAHYNVDKPVNIAIRDVNLDVNRVTVTRNGRGYNAGGFAVANQTARLSHNFSQEGDYVINVEAVDKAGNQYSDQITFTIDKTAPVITPKFRGESRVIKDGEYINKVFTPEFALDQGEDTIVSVTMNGSNVTGRIPTASLEMTYKYSVLARDKAGNETTIDISFILDTTKPNLNITGVLDGFFNKNQAPTVTFSDRYLDSSRSKVTLNGRPFVNGTQLSDEGDYILKAEIYDLANNVSTRTIVFTIDKTSPSITFKEAISEKYFNESLLPELLIEDINAYDIISQTLNGQPYNLGDPIEEEGKHVLFFEVKDKAGNIQQLSVEFIIDKTAPTIVVEGVKENETYRDPVTVSISLDNPSDTLKSVMINGELFDGDVKEVNGTQVISATLSDINKYEIEVVAFDEAGNEETLVVPFEIVEKSVFVKFYENKSLFAGTIVGLVAAAAAGGVALRRSIIRRRDSKDM